MAPTFNSDKRMAFDSIYQYSREDHLGCRTLHDEAGVSCRLRSTPLNSAFLFRLEQHIRLALLQAATSSVNLGELSSKEQHLRRVIAPDSEQDQLPR